MTTELRGPSGSPPGFVEIHREAGQRTLPTERWVIDECTETVYDHGPARRITLKVRGEDDRTGWIVITIHRHDRRT
jgi:hypothetical protein